jgi:peptidoglycan/LPS O-acetylase OafA/YrhL
MSAIMWKSMNETELKTDFTYRPFIDGLRAIAVIVVVLFHMRPEIFSGGYLGVDVFFVLSGFVITQSLYKNYISEGRINIFNFYLRRIKRLFPALLVMVLTVTAVYIFFGFLWDTNLYLKSAITSIFATSNLYFLFNGGNYFHQGLINPLLHTWSLGLEEQFYLVYPLLLAIGFWIMRKFRLSIKTIASSILGLSVILYLIFFFGNGAFYADFYFPTARFWEIGAGCFMFFLLLFSKYSLPRIWASLAGISSLAVIAGLQFFQKSINSLQIETLLTVIATSTLIYVGIIHGGLLIKFLGHKAMAYIGRLSYSLYLWHLPVIYLTNLYLDNLLFFILSPIISLGLAMFSYHLIEGPLRYSDILDRAVKFFLRAVPYIAILGIVFVLIIGISGVRQSVNNSFNISSEVIKPANYIESNFGLGERVSFDYRLNGRNIVGCIGDDEDFTLNNSGLKTECLKQIDSIDLFYVTGDSHAVHLIPALDNSSLIKNLYFTGFSRQAIASKNQKIISESEIESLMESRKKELEVLRGEFRNIYYITSMFLRTLDDQAENIEVNMRKYVELFDSKINLIFVAPTPVFQSGPESCVLLQKHCFIDKNLDLENRIIILDIYKNLEKKYENVHVYDLHNEVCGEEKCLIYDKEKDLLKYRDKDHFSIEQSLLLTPHFEEWFKETF